MVEGTGVRGRASAVQYRTEVSGGGGNTQTSTTHILLFRIERPGEPPIQVQMRGRFMNGTVADGDDVIAYGDPPRPGKVMKTKYVENMTTGIPVHTRWPLYAKIFAIPVIAIIIAIFSFLAYQFATNPP
ncbi:MAG TPA: hypothetical protein VF715_18545 [Thermoleophilaceae bacterium]